MDFNSHMRNTAYLDKSADVRLMFFAEHDFPVERFAELRMGPVIFKDEVEYFRELHMLDLFDVTLGVAGLSADGFRFRLCNEFFSLEGQRIARVTSTGGWLDLTARKRLLPPPELNDALQRLHRTDDFVELAQLTK